MIPIGHGIHTNKVSWFLWHNAEGLYVLPLLRKCIVSRKTMAFVLGISHWCTCSWLLYWPQRILIQNSLTDFCHVHVHTYIHGGQFYEQILEHIRHGHCLYVVRRPTQRTDAPSTPFTLLQHGRTLHGHGHKVPTLGAHWSLRLTIYSDTVHNGDEHVKY